MKTNEKKETVSIGITYKDLLLFYVRYYSIMTAKGKIAVENEISKVGNILDNLKQ